MAYSTYKFNKERYHLWVRYSSGFMHLDPKGSIFARMQGFGIIDAELYDINYSDSKVVVFEDIYVFDYANIKGSLWVLGVYELLRVIDQRIRENPLLVDDKAKIAIKDAKNLFGRVRIPLAKLEASRNNPKDYDIPELVGSSECIGWKMNDNEVIRYRDLSDSALNAFIEVVRSNISKNLSDMLTGNDD
jgi:hypothetical protein